MQCEIGQRVRIRADHLRGVEPSTWENEATVLKVELDQELTSLGFGDRYRITVDFDEGPFTPSKYDLLKWEEEQCYVASLLQRMLQVV